MNYTHSLVQWYLFSVFGPSSLHLLYGLDVKKEAAACPHLSALREAKRGVITLFVVFLTYKSLWSCCQWLTEKDVNDPLAPALLNHGTAFLSTVFHSKMSQHHLQLPLGTA